MTRSKLVITPRLIDPNAKPTKVEERMLLVLDVLRKSLVPLTRRELTAALGWPRYILLDNRNRAMDPLMLLMEEGKVERFRKGNEYQYKADPDISKLLTNR